MFLNEYINIAKWLKQDRIAAYAGDFKRFVVSHHRPSKAKNRTKKRRRK